MIVIGLTGSIASGKSTVSQFFREAGIPVIDTDLIAREVSARPEVVVQLGELFGPTIVQGGQLNRAALGAIIFQDAQARAKLDAYMHPLIKAETVTQLEAFDVPLVVIDVPLLFETDFQTLCDLSVVVSIPKQLQRERLMARDHCDAKLADAKIASQMPLADKCRLADCVIDNSQTREQTRKQVVRLIDKLKRI